MTAAARPGPAATFIPARKMGCLILKSFVRGVVIVVIFASWMSVLFARSRELEVESRGWAFLSVRYPDLSGEAEGFLQLKKPPD